ncbi:FHA domain-containing protein [Amycolatopsis kentuckyensis]|uniref:FHA domain-containing protein n=1 Tax=Amycolatopsis kentuckyensis TaxID=218823 RepID=UPI00356AD40C
MLTTVLILSVVVVAAVLMGIFMTRFERKQRRLLTRLRPVVRALVAEELERLKRTDSSSGPAEHPDRREPGPESAVAPPAVPAPVDDATEVYARPTASSNSSADFEDSEVPEEPPPTASIRAIRGENLDVLLTSRRMTFGRGSDRDIVLSAATVSRNHFTLLYLEGHWYIRDEGAPNGTFVNGTRITSGDPVALTSGDVIAASEDVELLLTTPDPPARDFKLIAGAAAYRAEGIGPFEDHCIGDDFVALAGSAGVGRKEMVAAEIAITIARGASPTLPLVHLVPAMEAAIRARSGMDRGHADVVAMFDGFQLLPEHRGNRVAGVHVGDGCAYVDDGVEVRSLTDGLEKGRPMGRAGTAKIGTWQEPAIVGWRFVLVTGGLVESFEAAELSRLLGELRGLEPQRAAEKLVALAVDRAETAGREIAGPAALVVEVGRRKPKLLLTSDATRSPNSVPLLLP